MVDEIKTDLQKITHDLVYSQSLVRRRILSHKKPYKDYKDV